MSFKEIRAPRYTLEGRELSVRGHESPPFNFDITQSYFDEDHRSIATIPNMGGLLLRWTSDRWQKGFGNMEFDIPLRAKAAREHHAQLESFGIRIPKYTHIAIGKAADSSAVAIYTVVERLDLLPWSYISKNAKAILDEKVEQPLNKYGDWVRTTNQPYQLEDLNSFDQYGFVHNASASYGCDAYLVDIECLVANRPLAE